MTNSRAKGAAAERELAGILREWGFDAARTAMLQTHRIPGAADVTGLPGWHIEAKRQERIAMQKWCYQAEVDAPEGVKPLVVFRTSFEPWRVTLRLVHFLPLVGGQI